MKIAKEKWFFNDFIIEKTTIKKSINYLKELLKDYYIKNPKLNFESILVEL